MGSRTYPEAGNQFDHYAVEYTFPDGGKLFAFSRHMNGCWNSYSDYVHGSKGSAVSMDSLAQPRPRIYRSQNMTEEKVVWRFPEDDSNPYRVGWQMLLGAIRQDRPHDELRRAADADLVADPFDHHQTTGSGQAGLQGLAGEDSDAALVEASVLGVGFFGVGKKGGPSACFRAVW